MKLNNKIAIGCLVQWYEIKIIEEYITSVEEALKGIDNKENIILDFTFVTNQDLEKIDPEQAEINALRFKFQNMVKAIDGNVKWRVTDELHTIADYRRDFNDKYCEEVDVLMWGESDSLIPKQTFQVLDSLHTGVKETTPKYVGFFGTCKMWDEGWKPIEHTDFTDKPFIENDFDNWWSLKYNMNLEEMNSFNDKVEELDVRTVSPYKFNGCGLIISSEVIKSGINIPRSVFFIHEDTAFMNSMIKMLDGSIPQYVIKNVLLVHNRKHPDKRMYVKGESEIENHDVGKKRLTHSWYDKANKMCEHNAYNMFNQSKTYTWEDVFNES